MPIYFDSQQLPQAQPEYVAWLDVMGIGPIMGRSVDAAANFIFKLHSAAVTRHRPGITIYPIMDGLYVSAADQAVILDFVRNIFEDCADEFLSVNNSQPQHRFIVRGAIAYGPIIHGSSVPSSAFFPPHGTNPFHSIANYQNSIMLGVPMVQAHVAERLAPPFGLYVHESARSFAPPNQKPLHVIWWRWAAKTNQRWKDLSRALERHYRWCIKNARSIEYDEDRIKCHSEWAKQYMK